MTSLKTYLAMAAIATTALSITPATAQNINADPNYETATLSGGFTPDPYNVQLQSGGTINAQSINDECLGFIDDAPDVRLHFEPGALPLLISVFSEEDTTLVINAPNGRWYCNDDGGNNLNPSIRFDPPQDGRYEIWVGTFGTSTLEAARLVISELYSE